MRTRGQSAPTWSSMEMDPSFISDDEIAPVTQARMKERIQVERKLPNWVVHYQLIEEDIANHSKPLTDMFIPDPVQRNLSTIGVDSLFPVQAQVIPEMLQSAYGPLLTSIDGPQDIVVCAPTGCGKTLAYAVPIVSTLINRVVRQVRGLIVVPSQELASQVCQVFQSLMHSTTLTVNMLSGGDSLSDSHSHLSASTCDVLVSTPAKLMDHINRSSFAALRYLVLDEADKLLKQSSNQWLSSLLAIVDAQKSRPLAKRSVKSVLSALCTTATSEQDSADPHTSGHYVHCPLQKLLLSASMTFDPECLTVLRLHQPVLFSVPGVFRSAESAFTVPHSLEQLFVRCSLEDKPITLVHLVSTMKGPVLCFANSRDTAHRLCLLLTELRLFEVAELSGYISKGRRRENLDRLRHGHTQVMVCSDQLARGMDLDNVNCVINYDPPRQYQTYLHRAGRTARAGRKGLVYTLLAKNQVHPFKSMIKQVTSTPVGELSVSSDQLDPFREQYKRAIESLNSNTI